MGTHTVWPHLSPTMTTQSHNMKKYKEEWGCGWFFYFFWEGGVCGGEPVLLSLIHTPFFLQEGGEREREGKRQCGRV